MEQYHLTPDGPRWTLTGEGPDRTMANFDTKIEAARRFHELIGGREGVLKVYQTDGTIEAEWRYPRSADV